jgi:UDP-GlcNAc:undecaprenyl-phosphate GlcNAc-1-phosphate transferase
MLKYLFPFIETFLLTIGLVFFALPLAKKIPWDVRDDLRHIHRKGVYRIGGIAMVLAFNLVVIFNKDLVMSSELFGFILASIILLFVGVWDDIKEVYWKTQLFFQIAISVLIFILGVRIYYITNPLNGGVIDLDLGKTVLIALLLVIFWVVFVINSLNWIDGVDGLSGGVSLISVATIFFLSFRPEVNQPPIAIMCSILAGAILGFLVFNFNPAKILAGTSGSMFMGFSLAVLAIFSGTKIATAILVLTIPLVDFIWVICERINKGESIFRPDNNHLHHKLLEIGWSQRKIAVYYYLITAIIGVIALNTRVIGKSITLLISILIVIFISLETRRKLAKLHRS